MKIYWKKETVFAESETVGDIKILLGLGKTIEKSVPKTEVKPKIKHKKHKFKKPCPICGKKLKGVKMHMTIKHRLPDLVTNALTV